MDFSLGRSYSLKSKKAIDQLFESGKKINAYPFSLWFNELSSSEIPRFQFVISAPKKKFRTAVQRNRIKRRCREAIRLNKSSFEKTLSHRGKQIQLFLIYIGDDYPERSFLEKKVTTLFNKVIQQLDEQS